VLDSLIYLKPVERIYNVMKFRNFDSMHEQQSSGQVVNDCFEQRVLMVAVYYIDTFRANKNVFCYFVLAEISLPRLKRLWFLGAAFRLKIKMYHSDPPRHFLGLAYKRHVH